MKFSMRDLFWAITCLCLCFGGYSAGQHNGFNSGYVHAFRVFCPRYPGNMVPVFKEPPINWVKEGAESTKEHRYYVTESGYNLGE